MDQPNSEAVAIIRSLLTIAKVAMPGLLFDIDPRVRRAKAYLGKAPEAAAVRVELDASPEVISEIIRRLDAAAEPAKDITLALDRYLADAPHHPTRSTALMEILRDWFRQRGYLDPAN